MSADGNALVFIDNSNDSPTVRVMDLAAMKSEALFNASRLKQAHRVFFRNPVLSPNRRYLSLLANVGTGVYEIVILDTINDAVLRPLPAQNALSVAWDASNTRLFFSIDPCTRNQSGARTCLGTLDMGTGRVTWFDAVVPRSDGLGTTPLGSIKSAVPVLSPSGKFLLVYSNQEYINSAVVFNLENGQASALQPRDINGDKVRAHGLSWSPDEKHFAFVYMNDIWVMDTDGNNAFPAEQSINALAPVLWKP